MNCEKSYKREMLKGWGMRKLAKGDLGADGLLTVHWFMKRMMRKTIAEVKEFVKKG